MKLQTFLYHRCHCCTSFIFLLCAKQFQTFLSIFSWLFLHFTPLLKCCGAPQGRCASLFQNHSFRWAAKKDQQLKQTWKPGREVSRREDRPQTWFGWLDQSPPGLWAGPWGLCWLCCRLWTAVSGSSRPGRFKNRKKSRYKQQRERERGKKKNPNPVVINWECVYSK